MTQWRAGESHCGKMLFAIGVPAWPGVTPIVRALLE
jgi:hypothetical protein